MFALKVYQNLSPRIFFCSSINSVLKNGHDYLFLKKCGSRKSIWKVCQLPGQRLFEVGIRRFCQRLESMPFMMALSVPSNFNCFWRGSMFKIFFRRESLEERTKTRLCFRALFVHCNAALQRVSKKKIPRTGLAFSSNGTFDDFFIFFFIFFMAAVCSGTMHTWEGKLIQ